MPRWSLTLANLAPGHPSEPAPRRGDDQLLPGGITYQQDGTPIPVNRVAGGLWEDGIVLLERRVIGLMDDVPGGHLVVRIEVDGVERCFCKAKYEEAKQAGVQHDYKSGTFYIDAVRPQTGRTSTHLFIAGLFVRGPVLPCSSWG